MSRKKHAWTAFWNVQQSGTSDELHRAERVVEAASVEDFTDLVYEETEQLLNLLDQAPNNDIRLGILMTLDAIRKTLNNWYS